MTVMVPPVGGGVTGGMTGGGSVGNGGAGGIVGFGGVGGSGPISVGTLLGVKRHAIAGHSCCRRHS